MAVLWYLIGRFLDQRRESQRTAIVRPQKTVFLLLTMIWGLFLTSWTILNIATSFPVTPMGTRIVRTESVIVCVILVVWSLLLTVYPIRRLSAAARRKKLMTTNQAACRSD